jgi:hypothetical protein
MTTLFLYTVYKNPKDYPSKFVVRRFSLEKPDPKPMIVCDSYEAAIAVIPIGCIRTLRHPEDEPQILETWL